MDYQLDANTDGIQLAGQLRELWGDVPLCIVSAAADEDLSRLAAQHGYDFLRKPVKPGKLRALLERYFQRKSA
jgi:DNA-binding response OmpR family regulator